jgi:hypothetical protein
MFIKLRLAKEITAEEYGSLLLDSNSIESVVEYDSKLMKGSHIRLKPVINGFHGDNDLIYKFQMEYDVAESLETILSLIETARKA